MFHNIKVKLAINKRSLLPFPSSFVYHVSLSWCIAEDASVLFRFVLFCDRDLKSRLPGTHCVAQFGLKLT